MQVSKVFIVHKHKSICNINDMFPCHFLGLVELLDFEHPTLQGVSYPLHFPPGRSLGLGAFAPSGRYYIIADNHLNSNPCLI